MNEQKEIMLSVIYLLEKVWGRTYLQKFFYLLNREVFKGHLFSYDLYKYGPFSEQINTQLTELEIEGLVEEKALLTKGLHTAYTYKLTKKGQKYASNIFIKLPNKTRDELVNYTNKFKQYSPTELLRFVYEKYPEVTKNSIYNKE
ncbi:MAG: hypothetical protein ABIJ18_04180 [archaeon]